jgi:hypothetical protein
MKRIAIATFLLLLFTQCSPDIAEKSWDVDVLTPIVRSTLDLSDVTGDTLLSSDSQGLYSLVRRQKVFEFRLDDLVEPFSTTFENTAKLQTLDLGTRRVQHSISLGQIAAGQGALGNLIILNNGNSLPLPAISATGGFQYDVDASSLFQSMILLDGWMVITIENGLPIDLVNFSYSLENKLSGSIVISGNIPLVPANGSVKDSVQLNNYTQLDGSLVARVNNLESPGSNGNAVAIDTTDRLTFNVVVRDLKPYEATAIFPAQNLIDYTEEVLFQNGLELTSIVVDTGILYMQAISTVDEAVYLDYAIPSATKNGQILLLSETLPPAPTGGTSVLNSSRDIKGFTVDLHGINNLPTVTNTFYAQLQARIDSTGNMAYISLEDSVYLTTGIQGLMPFKVEGWLGRDTQLVENEVLPLYLFEDVLSGSFDLEIARLEMELINPMGAQMQFRLSNVRTLNSANNNSAVLNWTLLGQNLGVLAATDDANASKAIPTVSRWSVDETNSNLDELFEVQPDQLVYDLELVINPSGLADPNGFAYRNQPLEAWLNLEIPLHLALDKLSLSDTSSFSYLDIDRENKLIEGVFTLIANNRMPLDAEISLIAIDSLGQALDTLILPQLIKSATLNNQSIVEGETVSRIDYQLTPDNIIQLKKANRLVFNGKYSTANAPDRIRLYDHYGTDLQLVGDFKYRVN